MTEIIAKQYTQEELIQEVCVLNEEADYHADRAETLQKRLDIALLLLKDWWGGNYQGQFYLSMQQRTQNFLIKVAQDER